MNDKDIKNRVKQFIDRLCHADKCNILAGNQEFVNYVFKNLEKDEYVMCTILPNWDFPELRLYDRYFITVQEVSAGEKYFNRKLQDIISYQYSGVYLINAIQYDEKQLDTLIL